MQMPEYAPVAKTRAPRNWPVGTRCASGRRSDKAAGTAFCSRHGQSCSLELVGREGPALCWRPSSQLGARPETETERKSHMLPVLEQAASDGHGTQASRSCGTGFKRCEVYSGRCGGAVQFPLKVLRVNVPIF